MSMGFYRYRIATDDEIKEFMDDIDDFTSFKWYFDKYSHKSYKNIVNKHKLKFVKNGVVYLRLVEIPNLYRQYGYPMKSGWFNHEYTDVIFDDIDNFKKYCYKYMNFKYTFAAKIFHSIIDTWEDGQFIAITC